MQFKASTDYGMRAILYLAAQGTTCSSKDIAQDMSIPRDYLIQLAQLLRNAGLIEARPGKHGGYRLAKEPSDITVLQIMKALEEDANEFARKAMEYDLFMVPSDSFGMPGYLRLSYCVETEHLRKAIVRLRQFVTEVYGERE